MYVLLIREKFHSMRRCDVQVLGQRPNQRNAHRWSCVVGVSGAFYICGVYAYVACVGVDHGMIVPEPLQSRHAQAQRTRGAERLPYVAMGCP